MPSPEPSTNEPKILNPPGFPHVVGSTMLNSFRACPHQFWWAYVRRQIPQLESVHLLAGGAFAKAIEAGNVFVEVNKWGGIVFKNADAYISASSTSFGTNDRGNTALNQMRAGRMMVAA